MSLLPHRMRWSRGAALLALALAACVQAPPRITPAQRAAATEAARQAVAAEAARDVATLPERSVAVAPFAVSLQDEVLAPLAYGLADLLMTDLARSRQVEVVDRLSLDATLRELQLAAAGRVDPATAPRVGRIVGARRLVVGSLTQPDGRQLGIQARVADVASTQVQDAVSATTTVDDVLRAEKELAFRVFDVLGVTLTPAERAAVERRQTQNLAALLAFSSGVRFELEGQLDQAAESYLGALRLDPAFARAAERLEDVRPGLLGTNRALDLAAGRLNSPVYAPTLGSAVDPAFLPSGTTLVIIITSPGAPLELRRIP